MPEHQHTQLDTALAIAVKAHAGQVDKAGVPYILHPLRVMAQLDDIQEKIIAVLHDVLEDSETTPDDLRKAGIDDYYINGVEKLTRKENQSYEDYIHSLYTWKICAKVKVADLRDNQHLERLLFHDLSLADLERIKKYHKALRELVSCLP